MAFTATQYLFKASFVTSTTTATVGTYVVPAATKGQVIAMTLANTSTGYVRNWADVQVFDGAVAYDVIGKRTPIDPGGSLIVTGIEKHTLPTGGSVYVTAYATTGLSAALSLIEVT